MPDVHNGIISLGVALGYKTSSTASSYTDAPDLQEVPDLGGTKEKIEVTTLADPAHMYKNGLIDYGDSLDFKFLYSKDNFDTLNALEGVILWQVTLPDELGDPEAYCTFEGECSVKLDGVGTNAPLTFTLSITPCSEMEWS